MTPKLIKSQFGGGLKQEAQTLEATRNNNLVNDYKTDGDRPPSSKSKNRLAPSIQTLQPGEKSNTPVNPQGFQGAPSD